MSVIGTISSQMDTLSAMKVLKELEQTIMTILIMARIPVNSEEAAFKIFTTLNDRGLRLSPPDLLLSYLMEKAPPDDRKEIRTTWTLMIQKMGNNDIEDFLRAMWVSRYGDLKDDLFVALKAYIEDTKIESLAYARQCLEECDDYIALLSADDTQLPKDSVPLVRAITRELGVKSALPVLLSGYLLLKPKDFESLARFLLVFITRYSIIGNRNTAGMENLLFKLAREIREKVSAPQDMHTSDQAIKHIKDSLKVNTPDDDNTRKAVREPGMLLEPSDAKYVISRLARFIQDPEKQVIPGNETNLEHVYPQSPEPDQWGGLLNQEKLEPFTWHIGNLTIFGVRANRRVGNLEYPQKRPKYALSQVNYAAEVIMLVRGDGLALSMSQYLIAQIGEKGNIRIEAWTEVTGVHGEEHLEQIVTTTRDPDGGRISAIRDADALFLMIGATANTSWLPTTLERDAKGYIYTGRDLARWSLDREPFPLETSLPGIFCAGDVRHGSIKRVASGVGEGSMSIAFIHQYLARTGSPDLTRV